MTNRTMYDALDLSGVPHTGASMIAYYLDVYPLSHVKALFPGWRDIPIDRHGDNPHLARVFDVENGDISPDSDLAFLIEEFNRTSIYYKTGGRPVMYCDRVNIPAVRQNTGKYRLGHDYYLWISAPGTNFTTPAALISDIMREFPHTPAFPNAECVVACQTEFHNGYDKSIVYSGQWVP